MSIVARRNNKGMYNTLSGPISVSQVGHLYYLSLVSTPLNYLDSQLSFSNISISNNCSLIMDL